MKLRIWDSATAKRELNKRLKNSQDYRSKFEGIWEDNERSLFNTTGRERGMGVGYSFDSPLDFGVGDVDLGNDSIGINYLSRNFRFIHAQMSANPPTVLARPTSSDPSDRKKADGADRLIRHAIRAERMQEKVDLASAKTLLYGTAFIKTVFDSNKGDISDYDPSTGEFELEGAIDIYSPSTWNMWIDPDARTWEDVRYLFERKTLTLEEALFLFPDYEDELKSISAKSKKDGMFSSLRSNEDASETVDIYEYWEKGLPINGMLGRFALCLEDGTLLEGVRPSPFSFAAPGESKAPPTAQLPYHLLTDIDIPDEVYGKSFIDYAAPIQDLINRLDSVSLDNIQAHGIVRMVLPEDTELADDALSNSTWDVLKIRGLNGPHYINPPQTMPETSSLRDRLKMGGDDVSGVNEAMLGQMSRETSGFSLQYATNQGNMIRRRLFNKYVLFVESIYKGYLNLVRKYWDEPQIINVLGREKAFESMSIKGADIDGGFDLVVEYGASLSLDPTTRREEILQLMPIFEKAGMDTKTLLSMLKLNELEGMYDIMELSFERQSEIFEEMIANNIYIAPKELEEHVGMLHYAYRFVMTAEFKYLEEKSKLLIEKHIKDREQLAAGRVQSMDMGNQAPGIKGPMPEELPDTSMAVGGTNMPMPE